MEFKTTKFSKISNISFLIISILALSFIWCNFYLKNFKLSFMSSTIITVAFCIIFFPIYNRTTNTTLNKEKNKNTLEEFKTKLLFCKTTTLVNKLNEIYNLKINKKLTDNHYISNESKKDIYIIYNNPIITQQEIYKIFQTSKYNNIEIFCFDTDKNIAILEDCQINFIKINDLFKTIQDNNINLDINLNVKKSNKYSQKSILCIVLSDKNAKKYFNLSILLLFSTLFMPFNIYYIICSTILMLLSIYCRFNKKFN